MGWLFHQNPVMLPAQDTLAGGRHAVLPHPQPHTVLGTPITGTWEPSQEIVWLALGCYWGAEQLFWQTEGVLSTAVGFAGGVTPNPTYREVCTGRTNHTEVVQVVFDPAVVSFDELIIKMFEAHDPTQGFRQGNDVGTQYRSAIYTRTEEQAARAREIAQSYAGALQAAGFGQITTEIMPLDHTPAAQFYLAEDEHQQYLDKNPNGYCPHHSTGVACNISDS